MSLTLSQLRTAFGDNTADFGTIGISINGGTTWKLFEPQNLRINFESLSADNAGRTDDGIMHTMFVRSKVRKLEVTLAPCTPDEAGTFFRMIQGREFKCKFYDAISDSVETMTAYTGNSQADCYSGILNSQGLYTGASANIIEV